MNLISKPGRAYRMKKKKETNLLYFGIEIFFEIVPDQDQLCFPAEYSAFEEIFRLKFKTIIKSFRIFFIIFIRTAFN